MLLRHVAGNNDLIANAGSVLAQYCEFPAVGLDGGNGGIQLAYAVHLSATLTAGSSTAKVRNADRSAKAFAPCGAAPPPPSRSDEAGTGQRWGDRASIEDLEGSQVRMTSRSLACDLPLLVGGNSDLTYESVRAMSQSVHRKSASRSSRQRVGWCTLNVRAAAHP